MQSGSMDPQLAASTSSGHRPRSPSPSPSMDGFREPDDSALFSPAEQHRFNKRVYSMLTTLTTQSSEILIGQEAIIRKLGDDGEHVIRRVVEVHVVDKVMDLQASLPCTTLEEWYQLETELGLGRPQRLSLVGIEF
jgi:hypothetical protein